MFSVIPQNIIIIGYNYIHTKNYGYVSNFHYLVYNKGFSMLGAKTCLLDEEMHRFLFIIQKLNNELTAKFTEICGILSNICVEIFRQ